MATVIISFFLSSVLIKKNKDLYSFGKKVKKKNKTTCYYSMSMPSF